MTKHELTPQEQKKANTKRIILLAVIGICLLVYFFVPSVNTKINTAVSTLFTTDINNVVEYIRGFGGYAVAVSFLLMVLQAIIAPIPAFIITLSNAAIWGWWRGAILSWTSSMVAAGICFWIARTLGRDAVEKLNTKSGIAKIEQFFERYGTNTIIIARLLPFVPFDPVSYVAGLTSMGFWEFFWATGIGQLPATVIYSYAGGQLTGGAQKMFIGLLILFGGSAIVTMAKKMYDEKYKDEETENPGNN